MRSHQHKRIASTRNGRTSDRVRSQKEGDTDLAIAKTIMQTIKKHAAKENEKDHLQTMNLTSLEREKKEKKTITLGLT
ncbi:hypothetical protein GB937_000370 [Aspergillus fischeri]|nr:hypothetical protein GB937_000370 [Aspergillus fischeri]